MDNCNIINFMSWCYIGEGIITLMSIPDGLSLSVFCPQMEPMQLMKKKWIQIWLDPAWVGKLCFIVRNPRIFLFHSRCLLLLESPSLCSDLLFLKWDRSYRKNPIRKNGNFDIFTICLVQWLKLKGWRGLTPQFVGSNPFFLQKQLFDIS